MSDSIKYSDIVVPDNSVQELLQQLNKVQSEITESENVLRKRQQALTKSIRETNVNSKKGKAFAAQAVKEAESLTKAKTKLRTAEAKNAVEIAKVNEQIREQNKLNRLNAQLANAEKGSLAALEAQYKLNLEILKRYNSETLKSAQGQRLTSETSGLAAQIKSIKIKQGNDFSSNVGKGVANALKGSKGGVVNNIQGGITKVMSSPVINSISYALPVVGRALSAVESSVSKVSPTLEKIATGLGIGGSAFLGSKIAGYKGVRKEWVDETEGLRKEYGAIFQREGFDDFKERGADILAQVEMLRRMGSTESIFSHSGGSVRGVQGLVTVLKEYQKSFLELNGGLPTDVESLLQVFTINTKTSKKDYALTFENLRNLARTENEKAAIFRQIVGKDTKQLSGMDIAKKREAVKIAAVAKKYPSHFDKAIAKNEEFIKSLKSLGFSEEEVNRVTKLLNGNFTNITRAIGKIVEGGGTNKLLAQTYTYAGKDGKKKATIKGAANNIQREWRKPKPKRERDLYGSFEDYRESFKPYVAEMKLVQRWITKVGIAAMWATANFQKVAAGILKWGEQIAFGIPNLLRLATHKLVYRNSIDPPKFKMWAPLSKGFSRLTNSLGSGISSITGLSVAASTAAAGIGVVAVAIYAYAKYIKAAQKLAKERIGVGLYYGAKTIQETDKYRYAIKGVTALDENYKDDQVKAALDAITSHYKLKPQEATELIAIMRKNGADSTGQMLSNITSLTGELRYMTGSIQEYAQMISQISTGVVGKEFIDTTRQSFDRYSRGGKEYRETISKYGFDYDGVADQIKKGETTFLSFTKNLTERMVQMGASGKELQVVLGNIRNKFQVIKDFGKLNLGEFDADSEIAQLSEREAQYRKMNAALDVAWQKAKDGFIGQEQEMMYLWVGIKSSFNALVVFVMGVVKTIVFAIKAVYSTATALPKLLKYYVWDGNSFGDAWDKAVGGVVDTFKSFGKDMSSLIEGYGEVMSTGVNALGMATGFIDKTMSEAEKAKEKALLLQKRGQFLLKDDTISEQMFDVIQNGVLPKGQLGLPWQVDKEGNPNYGYKEGDKVTYKGKDYKMNGEGKFELVIEIEQGEGKSKTDITTRQEEKIQTKDNYEKLVDEFIEAFNSMNPLDKLDNIPYTLEIKLDKLSDRINEEIPILSEKDFHLYAKQNNLKQDYNDYVNEKTNERNAAFDLGAEKEVREVKAETYRIEAQLIDEAEKAYTDFLKHKLDLFRAYDKNKLDEEIQSSETEITILDNQLLTIEEKINQAKESLSGGDLVKTLADLEIKQLDIERRKALELVKKEKAEFGKRLKLIAETYKEDDLKNELVYNTSTSNTKIAEEISTNEAHLERGDIPVEERKGVKLKTALLKKKYKDNNSFAGGLFHTKDDIEPETGEEIAGSGEAKAELADKGIRQVMDNVISGVEDYTAALVAMSEAEYNYWNRKRENAENFLNKEVELRDKGLANRADQARKEYEFNKQMEEKAIAKRNRMNKIKIAADTALQASNMVLATSEIWKTYAAMPPLAIALTATMWGSFLLSKAMAIKQANQAADLAEHRTGTYDVIDAGSHQDKKDTIIGEWNGKKHKVEGGEGIAVFSKLARKNYPIRDIVTALNAGTYKTKNGAILSPIVNVSTESNRDVLENILEAVSKPEIYNAGNELVINNDTLCQRTQL